MKIRFKYSHSSWHICSINGSITIGLPETPDEPLYMWFSSILSLTLCDPMNCSTARPPCPSPTSRVHSNSRPSSRWCHSSISSSVVPFSSCCQSLPASESFPMSQLFTRGATDHAAEACRLRQTAWQKHAGCEGPCRSVAERSYPLPNIKGGIW